MSEEKILELLDESKTMILAYGLDLVGAIILLIIGWLIAGWAERVTARMVGRSQVFDDTLKPLFSRIVRYTILIFVIIAVLAQFGVQTASIIAVLGAAGLAVGLALQGTLSNIAAGVVLLVLRPIKVSDAVDVGGTDGTVMEIGLFTTQLKTFDGVFISMPNSQVWGSTIKNFSHFPTRRVDLTIGIGYGDDIDKAFDVMKDIIAGDDRVLSDPEPVVMVKSLGDSSVNLGMRFWGKREDYWDLIWKTTKQVKLRFDQEDISIPFPQRDIHIIGEALKIEDPSK